MSDRELLTAEKQCAELIHVSRTCAKTCGKKAKWKTPTGGFVCGHHRNRVDAYYSSGAATGRGSKYLKCEAL